MSFERPWVLLFTVLPVIWVWWTFRSGLLDKKQKIGLIFKALSIVAIIASLSEPQLTVSESKVAVAVLVDTSASVSSQDLAKASQLADRLENASGRNWMKVFPFASGTRSAVSEERLGQWKLQYTAGQEGRGTDLEAAVREASAALPEGMIPRIVLMSDGQENRGSITRAAWQAKELGIPVDVYPLSGRAQPALRLESINIPVTAFAGERFGVELTVSSPKNATGQLEIRAEGKQIGLSAIELQTGENRLLAHASLNVTGSLLLSGTVRAEGLGELEFAQAVTMRRPQLLFVSEDPQGTEQHLLSTLRNGQFDVKRAASADDRSLAESQIVILNNQDLEHYPQDRKLALERFVKEGGGLAVIGGEKNVYVEKPPRTPEDPLERTLPAKLAPPRTPEGTCVVLIIDKSSSMEGRKMDLARLAAIGVIENLRPVDLVGVLIFDNSFQWAVPIRKAEDRTLIKRLVAGITPDGGTQIAPALSEAFRRTVPVKATFKHIVLLTDGISEEGDSIAIAREAFDQKVTISTVGLGQDVNRAYLERIATLSKGKPYFLNDPAGLERILLRDVMEHTGSTAIERATRPIVAKQVEILDGIDMTKAPALNGYVKFQAKPSAESILNIPGTPSEPDDPLLVRWQYGLGRVAVFTSDAKSRWAEPWVNWNGFDRFWANLTRDLLPHADSGEAKADYDPATGDLIVNYRLGSQVTEPAKVPDIFVLGPDGFQKPIPIQKIASRAYRGKIQIDDQQGFFRIRPLNESRAFPETGFYREERELKEYGANSSLLKQIAEFTGGQMNPDPASVFQTGNRSLAGVMNLWPGLIALAIALNLAEILIRKWAGMPFRKTA